MDYLRDSLLLVGRVPMGALFIYDAALFLHGPARTVHFMEQAGVPGVLFWPTALGLLVCGLLIIAGFAARPAAVALAVFCLLTAVIFHHPLAGTGPAIQFGKDMGLAGGYLALAVAGPGRFSLGRRGGRR